MDKAPFFLSALTHLIRQKIVCQGGKKDKCFTDLYSKMYVYEEFCQ